MEYLFDFTHEVDYSSANKGAVSTFLAYQNP